MSRRTATRIGVIALGAAALAAAWAVLAPPQLGGATRYVILDGSSMEPSLEAGDLALVRGTDDVSKGDVVLYEHPGLDARVLHRVVRETGGRLVLKGDNNDFLDDVRPAADAVEGELWLSVPHVGSAIVWVREPLHAALAVLILSFVALGGLTALVASRRRTSGRSAATHGSSSFGPSVVGIALAAVAVFGLLAVVAFSRPATRAVEVPDAYAHVGTFSYGEQVEVSDVYPDGLVETGDTAFLQLVSALDVGFRYALDARDASGVRGATTLTAVLSDGIGWTRTLPLGEPVAFTGRSAAAEGRLDLEEITRVVGEMKALTGSGTSVFSVTVAAAVNVRGRVDEQPVTRAFAPKLRLTLDPVGLSPEGGDDGPSAFTVRRSEAIQSHVPATIALGSRRLTVTDARRFALLGIALALVAAGLAGSGARRRDDGGPSHVAALLGDRLLTLSRPPSAEAERVTELRDVASLVQIAEHYDRIVLHWRDGRGDCYQVEDGTGVYRFRVGAVSEDDEDTLVLAPQLPRHAATS